MFVISERLYAHPVEQFVFVHI